MKEKIDVKKLISQLTLEMYEALFKELDIPIFSKSKTQWVLRTGCHNTNANTASPKLYFYLDTKLFVCYSGCNATFNLVTLVMKRLALLGEDGGFLNAINYILSKTGLDKTAVSRINPNKSTYDWQKDFGKFLRMKSNSSELITYNKTILAPLSGGYPQEWIDEDISIESMQKYQIGYYERLNQTTIPVFDREGQLIGIRIRNWNPDLARGAKYMPLITLDGTCYKFPTDNVFYGINFNWSEIERTKTCFIGESEKFVLKMDSFYGRESTALGMFGSNLGLRRRNELLKLGVERVVYVPDNDFEEYGSEEYKEWEKKIQQFAKLFVGYCQFEVVWASEDGLIGYKENATDRDKATWDLLYENRQIWKLKEGKDKGGIV